MSHCDSDQKLMTVRLSRSLLRDFRHLILDKDSTLSEETEIALREYITRHFVQRAVIQDRPESEPEATTLIRVYTTAHRAVKVEAAETGRHMTELASEKLLAPLTD